MDSIKTTDELIKFCDRATRCAYVTVDTEFLRERTYYSKLCLIQLAFRDEQEGECAVLVDPLSDTLDLAPLYDLFKNINVTKVFHAARQDLEIFYHDAGIIPEPLFDTQVAAMVCNFGEQVGYETLVRKICKQGLDKTSRFTDWSIRPLSEAQQKYALADVTHLRNIYEFLRNKLIKTGRDRWVKEELAVLTDPETYITRPQDAWMRVKTRSSSANFLAIVQELASFREQYAQTKNVPRSRVFKDDALIEMASIKPKNGQDLSRSRLLVREARRGEIADGILQAVVNGLARDPENLPQIVEAPAKLKSNGALADLLRVLLKAKSEQKGVAAKLIASTSDLDSIASGERNLPALKGWRREVFGNDALRLCNGEVALIAKGQNVKTIEIQ